MTMLRRGFFALTLLAAACSGPPPTVGAITIVNGTDHDLSVEVSDGDRAAWLPLASVEAGSERISEEVLDQGDTWVFRFLYQGEPVGEVSVSRSELERDRWRLEVPERAAETLGSLDPPAK